MPNFVQGFLAELILDGNDITFVTADFTFDESKTGLDKSVMDGSGDTVTLPGKKSGTLSINGHIDQTNLNLLEVTWGKETTVPFSFTVKEGLGLDAQYTGDIALTDFSKSTSADGNWAFSITGNTSAVVFTPSAP